MATLRKFGRQKSFTEEREDRIKSASDLASRYYSLPLYLIFWFADLIYAPEYKWQFLFYRLSVVPSLLLVNRYLQKSKGLIKTQLICSLYTVVNTWPIIAMILHSGDRGSPYYAGLMLVTFGIGIFIPWTLPFFIVQNAIILVPYFLGPLLVLSEGEGNRGFLNLFFLFGAVSIVTVVWFLTERLRRQEYHQRLARQRELLNRERIIKRKTKEQLRLERLSRQFSPQVVASIKKGILDIDRMPMQASICGLVIDICGYTRACRRVSGPQVQTVLNLFYRICVQRMFKYDITFDKTIGDAVLGFSNEPERHKDYVARVAQAALEIQEEIEKRKEEFITLWGEALQVKIGIAEGQAEVGFFGDENSPKNYTASGEVMNLTARLCEQSSPGQILITESAYQHLVRTSGMINWGSFELSNTGVRVLKGYEDAPVTCYNLERKIEAQSKIRFDCPTCPNGHGQLHLAENAQGLFVFQCRTCEYVADGIDSLSDEIKAA